MRKYKARIADKILEKRLLGKGAVLIEGAKWCGKTTTAEQIAGTSGSPGIREADCHGRWRRSAPDHWYPDRRQRPVYNCLRPVLRTALSDPHIR